LTKLRLHVAQFVLLASALFPLLLASPAQADATYTLEQYNALVAADTSAVQAAQTALDSANATLFADITAKALADQAVVDGATVLAAAQAAYDNSSVPVVSQSGSGIHVDIYNNTYHTMSPNPSNLCRSDTLAQIAANWGNGSVAGCNSDRVTIHYTGTITVPTTGAYRFMDIADDGFYMTFDGQLLINDWRDKGCGGSWSPYVQLTAGTAYSIDAWYYENGGGACSTLYYATQGTNQSVVPASWFGTATTTYAKDSTLLPAIDAAKADADNRKTVAIQLATQVTADQAAVDSAQVALDTAKAALAAIPPMEIDPPTNLVATVDGGTVTLAWNAPTANLIPERYAVTWTIPGANGWGVASTTTSITLDKQLFSSTGGWNKDYTFMVRSDNDSAPLYSQYSNSVTVHLNDPTPPVVVVIPPSPSETPTAKVETHTVVDVPTPSPSVSPAPETTTSVVQETATAQTPEPTPSPSPTPAPSPEPSVEPQPQSPSQTDTGTGQTTSQPIQSSTGSPSDSQTVSPVTTDPAPTPQPAPQPEPVNPVVAPVVRPEPSPEPAPAETPSPQPDPSPTPAPAADASPAPEPKPTDSASPTPDPSAQPTTAPTPEPKPTPQPSPSPAPEPSAQPAVTPSPQPTQPSPAPTPASTEPAPASSNLIPNNPNSLSDTTPKVAPADALVAHVQVDKPGVENGGIEFFGTKSAPQVVGEDGKLTPPAPPPGSGLPIPPEAITVTATFIGQPGGTTFNAPDIAVPVIETPVTGAIAAVPGVQVLNHAFVAMANIGNDMSPVTRKKAKKILVITAVLGQISQLRRRF